MIATQRIYKPGTRAKVETFPTLQDTPSKAHGNGAGHPGPDEAQPFPLDCLPPVAAKMAAAIAHTERTPEVLAGCCTLGIVSASIGAGLQVKSGPDRVTRGRS